MNTIRKLGLLAASMSAVIAANAQADTINVYNWSDYIAEDTIANFEQKSGHKVVYDVFDSNEVLEAKLLTGQTGFDVVVPSASFLGRQIRAGVFTKLERDKLPNWKHLDPLLMSKLEVVDPGNQYAVPYLWGTTGIGFNEDKVKQALGEDYEVNSWDMVFDPDVVSKLADCGVVTLDAASEMVPAALHYLGLDPNSKDADEIQQAGELLKSIRPHIRYFHSSQYINDLANGDICVAVGWSGDVFQAADRADEADNGVSVGYVIPKEGAAMWFDMLAIPADAKSMDAAYQFVNHLLEPEVIAGVSDYVWYPNANKSATSLVDPEITSNPAIYPPQDVMEKLYTFEVMPARVSRVVNRVWTDVKSGR
ncbi:extracellular solute-binding protein [Lacimicrobium alkaliphilum]|uniref:Putrescine-binding periplasmic protein n=1 Tax=Lacimicrobium alkaliphilum TaxID=1526571 RepID=A0ABQ1RBQ7_9ALTE|nr:extracellular solute-binding protein [Lacimicrobium alkaliphilum]GGD63136.1 putrescine-binding periplasmic protein [Lacimicrobium alkaliphilum]